MCHIQVIVLLQMMAMAQPMTEGLESSELERGRTSLYLLAC
jgi:hypothetical protein